jgi:hypothetical protein
MRCIPCGYAAAAVCHRRRRIEEIEQHIAISWFRSAVMTGRTRPRPFFFQFSLFLKKIIFILLDVKNPSLELSSTPWPMVPR